MQPFQRFVASCKMNMQVQVTVTGDKTQFFYQTYAIQMLFKCFLINTSVSEKSSFPNSKPHFATAKKMPFLSAFSYAQIICNYYLGQVCSPFLKGLANANRTEYIL